MPNTSEDLTTSQSGTSKYWKPTVLITYESTNDDGLQNREYVSGAKCFQQNDGSASAPNFYYDGSRTQIAMLWEK